MLFAVTEVPIGVIRVLREGRATSQNIIMAFQEENKKG